MTQDELEQKARLQKYQNEIESHLRSLDYESLISEASSSYAIIREQENTDKRNQEQIDCVVNELNKERLSLQSTLAKGPQILALFQGISRQFETMHKIAQFALKRANAAEQDVKNEQAKLDRTLKDFEQNKSKIYELGLKEQATQMSRKGVQARRENQAKKPKQKAFDQVKECWRLWQQNPMRYDSKAAFALDMVTKYDDLKSTKVIEDKCRDWEKESTSTDK